MKPWSGKTSFVIAIVFALAPCFAAAQTTSSQSTTLLALLNQLNSLEQELSSIQATINSLLGNATSTLSASSTTSLPSLGTVLPNETTPCPALASYLGIATSQMCAGSDLSQQPIVPQSDADPVGALLDALSPPIASIVSSVTNTAPSASVLASVPSTVASTTPAYASLVNTSCSTEGATITVTGGFSCIGICMPIPSSILQCKSGTWQQQ